MALSNELMAEKWQYIIVDDYIEKYGGEENLTKGFNQAEHMHEAMLMSANGKEEKVATILNESNEINVSDVYRG